MSSEQPQFDSVVTAVINSFKQRAEVGQKKYGTNLDRTDLSTLDWIQHAQEEHMDAILYLEKLKQCFQNQEKPSQIQAPLPKEEEAKVPSPLVPKEQKEVVVKAQPKPAESEKDRHLSHWAC